MNVKIDHEVTKTRKMRARQGDLGKRGQEDKIEIPSWFRVFVVQIYAGVGLDHHPHLQPDRKSTRLNSSHSQISYAVFCLKKKNILQHKSNILPVPPPEPLHAQPVDASAIIRGIAVARGCGCYRRRDLRALAILDSVSGFA